MIPLKTNKKYLSIIWVYLFYFATGFNLSQAVEVKSVAPATPILLKGKVDIIQSALEASGIQITSTKLPAQITNIHLGSLAYYAGLAAKDTVISAHLDGQKIFLTIERNGKTYSCQLDPHPTKNILFPAHANTNFMQPNILFSQTPSLEKLQDKELYIEIPKIEFQLRAQQFSTPDNKPAWVIRLNNSAIQTPVYDHGKLFISCGLNYSVCALDAKTGSLLWNFKFNPQENCATSAVVDNELCAFNTSSCSVFVVDANTGNCIWHRWIAGVLDTEPAIANNRLYVAYPPQKTSAHQGCGLLCLDLRHGNQLWDTPLPSKVIYAPIISYNNVYVSCIDGSTVCLDASDGSITWKSQTGGDTPPLVINGQIFHASGESNGLEQHRNVSVWGYDGGRPVCADRLIIQVKGDSVEAIDPIIGTIHWVQHLNLLNGNSNIKNFCPGFVSRASLSQNILFSPAMGIRNVYLTSIDGHIISLRPEDGKINFRYATGRQFNTAPCLANGWLYVGTQSGELLGLYVGPDADGWTAWGGNSQHNKIR